jgi:hypothetical protein
MSSIVGGRGKTEWKKAKVSGIRNEGSECLREPLEQFNKTNRRLGRKDHQS